jgi:hypothetical protein
MKSGPYGLARAKSPAGACDSPRAQWSRGFGTQPLARTDVPGGRHKRWPVAIPHREPQQLSGCDGIMASLEGVGVNRCQRRQAGAARRQTYSSQLRPLPRPRGVGLPSPAAVRLRTRGLVRPAHPTGRARKPRRCPRPKPAEERSPELADCRGSPRGAARAHPG